MRKRWNKTITKSTVVRYKVRLFSPWARNWFSNIAHLKLRWLLQSTVRKWRGLQRLHVQNPAYITIWPNIWVTTVWVKIILSYYELLIHALIIYNKVNNIHLENEFRHLERIYLPLCSTLLSLDINIQYMYFSLKYIPESWLVCKKLIFVIVFHLNSI